MMQYSLQWKNSSLNLYWNKKRNTNIKLKANIIYLIELASDPDEGSVKQNAATLWPVETKGKYFFFCSGVPYSKMPFKNEMNIKKHIETQYGIVNHILP